MRQANVLIVVLLVLQQAACLHPCSRGGRAPLPKRPTEPQRRQYAVVAAAAGMAASVGVLAAFAADDASSGTTNAIQGIVESLSRPGFEVQYDGPYMDRETGTLRYPITGVESKDPVSAAALLVGAGATRFGGIFPDEMPFNIVQKIIRGVLPRGWFPDLADDDFRKQFQDTWYGTDEEATWLPAFMRSQRATAPPADEPPAPVTPLRGSETGDDQPS